MNCDIALKPRPKRDPYGPPWSSTSVLSAALSGAPGGRTSTPSILTPSSLVQRTVRVAPNAHWAADALTRDAVRGVAPARLASCSSPGWFQRESTYATRPPGPATGALPVSPCRSTPSSTVRPARAIDATRVDAPCSLKKNNVSEVAFHIGVDASSSKLAVSLIGVVAPAAHTQRSAFSTCFFQSLVPAHASQRPSGDHSKPPCGSAPSLRASPPLAATIAMSVRLPSSTMPVGLRRKAIDFESGDHSGSATMNLPLVTRACLPVATSMRQRWLYCGISSSTTWSHFFLRQSFTCFGSVSSIVYAIDLPSGDHCISPTDSTNVASFHGSPPVSGSSQMLVLPSSLSRGEMNASVSPPGENCGA